MTRPRPIIVGTDGSDHARYAIEWAACEAGLRHVPLRVFHAFVWPLLRIPPVFASIGPAGGLRAHASDLLSEAASLAQAVAPGIDVQTAIRTAFPAELLAAESSRASYAVVGSRGLGAVGCLLAGSTTAELIVRAHCPVAVIGRPETEATAAPVLVGIDGSRHSEAALETAIDLATHWDAPIKVVHVVPALQSGQRDAVDQILEPWLDKHPSGEVEAAIVLGHPAGVLVELSKAARVLVVGSRGAGGFAGMLHGSVSQAVVHHAHCAVVVVP